MQPYVFREKKKGRVEWLEQIPLHKSQAVVRHFPFWLLCTFAESTENWSGASNRSSNSLTLIELLAEALWRTSQPPLHRVGKFCTVCLIVGAILSNYRTRATLLRWKTINQTHLLFFSLVLRVEMPCPALPAEMTRGTQHTVTPRRACLVNSRQITHAAIICNMLFLILGELCVW